MTGGCSWIVIKKKKLPILEGKYYIFVFFKIYILSYTNKTTPAIIISTLGI
jgi:hypothetical protein